MWDVKNVSEWDIGNIKVPITAQLIMDTHQIVSPEESYADLPPDFLHDGKIMLA